MIGPKKIIGWREWVKLPDLGVDFIKAKIDTGARTSSLHAFNLDVYRRRGKDWVRFEIQPEQRSSRRVIEVKAVVEEFRKITSSNGQATERPVIITEVVLLGEAWNVELTLANRDEMGFRMLLGRQAFRGRMLVDAGKSYYSVKPGKLKKSSFQGSRL